MWHNESRFYLPLAEQFEESFERDGRLLQRSK